MKKVNRIISAVVTVCFLFSTVVSDYALALSPRIASSDPNSTVPTEVLSMATVKFLANKDNVPEIVEAIDEQMLANGIFTGLEPKIDGVDFKRVDAFRVDKSELPTQNS